MLKIDPANIIFETPYDLIDYTMKGHAPNNHNFDKLQYAIDSARISFENGYNNDDSNSPVSEDLINAMDSMSFEDILRYIHKVQQKNDFFNTVKIIGAFGLGFFIGQKLPRISRF